MPPEKRQAKELLAKGLPKAAGGQDLTITEATILTTHITQTSHPHTYPHNRPVPVQPLHPGRRSHLQRSSFNDEAVDPCTGRVDPVHGPWTYSTDLSLEK
jgi:hypothetical protein